MFEGKVVIITGSSVGIGAGMAARFAKEGANVVIHGRKNEALQGVKQKCLEAGGENAKVHVCVGDISDEKVQQNLVDSTIKKFGKIDILVNNAALWALENFTDSSMETFDKLVNVNLRSVIALTKLVMPHLIETKGNVVNISSEVGQKPSYHGMFYSITKAALDHFTKCLALEMGPKGVRVNAVSPGAVGGTQIARRVGATEDDIKKFYDHMNDVYPLRRTGTVDEVCDAVIFIASEKAKFVTGVLLPVDGGSVVC